MRAIAAFATLALLPACATSPTSSRSDAFAAVIAKERAFAQAAQDDGMWTAQRRFMATDAYMVGRDGPFSAKPHLQDRVDRPFPALWAPHSVWLSCDATLAVTYGVVRSRRLPGRFARFVTVWRLADGEYRWEVEFAGPLGVPDVPDPDPVPRHLPDCGSAQPVESGAAKLSAGLLEGASNDGTLTYIVELLATGERRFQASFAEGEGYVQVVELSSDRFVEN